MKLHFRDSEGGEHTVEASPGRSLRDLLIRAGLSPHNAGRFASCQGFGTCGTCAVHIEGEVEPAQPGAVESWRLGFPPHSRDAGLRLACQIRPRSDLRVTKHKGFWGQDHTALDAPTSDES